MLVSSIKYLKDRSYSPWFWLPRSKIDERNHGLGFLNLIQCGDYCY